MRSLTLSSIEMDADVDSYRSTGIGVEASGLKKKGSDFFIIGFLI